MVWCSKRKKYCLPLCILAILWIISIPKCTSQNPVFYKVTKSSHSREDSIIIFAKSLLGIPYKYASSSKEGFDCSGFVYYVFKKFDISIPRSSILAAEVGKLISIEDADRGDLICFKGTNLNDSKVGHIGIVISKKGQPLEFIHSSSSKNHNGVVITKMEFSRYNERFIKIKRVL